eukprot:TsM_000372100 transcript=TsM_000372100 gene=TsM_000372100
MSGQLKALSRIMLGMFYCDVTSCFKIGHTGKEQNVPSKIAKGSGRCFGFLGMPSSGAEMFLSEG